MNFNDLLAERFDGYFNAAHSGNPLWLFVHVPKTAGSSLNGELLPLWSPNHHLFIDYSKLDAADAAQSYEVLFDRSVDRFIDMAQTTRFKYCTGHINAAQVQRIVDNVPNVRPVTLLREPVSRFVSDYRYQCSPMHPGHEQFAAEFPRIEDYLRLEGDWNKLSTSLLPADLIAQGDAETCASWLANAYSFVGLYEMYALSLHALTWFAGMPRRPKVRRRINTPTPESEIVLTEDLVAEIRARNAKDIALFEALAPRFMAVSDHLTTYLNRVAPRPLQG
jgi:hypothetical protein